MSGSTRKRKENAAAAAEDQAGTDTAEPKAEPSGSTSTSGPSEPEGDATGQDESAAPSTTDATESLVDEVTEDARSAVAKARARTRALATEAVAKLPDPARERIDQTLTSARQRPVPAAVVVVTAILGVVLVQRLIRTLAGRK